MPHATLAAATFAAALLACAPARAADPASDALATCLSTSAQAADRSVLVQGVFTAVIAHPDLAALATVDTARRDAVRQRAGAVLQRLITQDGRAQARTVLASGGVDGAREALSALGQRAMADFSDDPAVQAGLAELVRHVDPGAVLEALLSP